jgi:3-hydroxyisobutyrate dehydrogenase-like beta-hydroxyacid dehydrogenase
MTDTGVIGVGQIGKLFVDRLTEAGRSLTAFDVDDDQVAYAAEKGASAAETPEAVARNSDVVVMAVPGSPEVEATMEGKNGLLAGLGDGDVVVDATTTHPDTSVVCERTCEEVGAEFVEATITGGSPREGYHVMAGGTEAAYERATPTLDVISDDHVHVGPVPDATVFKLGLQMRYAGRHAVDAEVVEFVRDNGVDPEIFTEFLAFEMFDGYISGDFSKGVEGLGGLAIWHKDIGYARDYARDHGTALPVNAVVHEAYKTATRRAGDDEGDASALITYWLALNDAEDRYERGQS